ncbi:MULTISPECIES: type VII secretion integral membrane protein EccD [Mycobacteroides]|uniref:type VII secretion integral membrane protein EccD n=1 Tax=Mycobacteroides TaxID=670516 RepID=UPI0007E358F5|nr:MULTISPECIES: type VII secretion integral membrane protein EccD [Mycobacteroides]SKT85012.1 type VII secretion integral membrane protein EccD [Mycobacteroides abscessus subsp. massiliense]SKU05655.1 type VII secretion integral membrane protein EccD [Mycobacteroides abscessus subsp. massiliense]
MTSPADRLIRVAIVGPHTVSDMALPVSLSVRELIPRIEKILATGRDDESPNSDAPPTAKEFAATVHPYSLAPIGGTPFSLDANLETLAIADGTQLTLCPLPPGPAAPPVVEDLADAAVIHNKRKSAQWDHDALKPIAYQMIWLVLAFATAFCALTWFHEPSWWTLSALAACALAPAAATVWLRRRNTDLSDRCGVAAIAPLALAVAAVNPGGYGAPRVLLAALVLTAWSLLSAAVWHSRFRATHTGVVATSLGVASACAARIWWHWPNLTLGCALIIAALLLAHYSPALAAVSAKWPLPYVPSPGERLPDAPTRKVLAELPRKTAATNAYLVGFVAASVLLQVIGSVLLVWRPDRPTAGTSVEDWAWLSDPLTWWFLVATALVVPLRMRIWKARTACVWFLISPVLTAAALAVSFTATGHVVAGRWALGVVIALSGVIAAAAAMRKPIELSIMQRGILDWIENILLATVLPTAVWLLGLVMLVANLGLLR